MVTSGVFWFLGLEFAERYPPLPCRASPPQGGRSTRGEVSAISTFENEVVVELLADLPP